MANRFLRRKSAADAVAKLTIKAILERNLISEGDRILIAASGGKDSTVMAWALASARPALKRDYTLGALHISGDFEGGGAIPGLGETLNAWGIPFEDLEIPIMGRLKEKEKMNCYWCSTQRRTELLKYAIERGYNKIALGHHLDDIIETFFMNICGKGELLAMPMELQYRKYPVSLIRPLGYLEERQIIACADTLDLLARATTCPYGLNSKRRDIRDRIGTLTGGSGSVKRRILKALATGASDLLFDGAGET